ncbi:MAG TPA: hypothetical protein PKL97_06255 [Candidatus Omnitrophota bacterium]|nr:hypothetical protein [Candidatus Omnitrophota bacterium]
MIDLIILLAFVTYSVTVGFVHCRKASRNLGVVIQFDGEGVRFSSASGMIFPGRASNFAVLLALSERIRYGFGKTSGKGCSRGDSV